MRTVSSSRTYSKLLHSASISKLLDENDVASMKKRSTTSEALLDPEAAQRAVGVEYIRETGKRIVGDTQRGGRYGHAAAAPASLARLDDPRRLRRRR